MRLDFNLVVVDDDWDDPDRSINIKRLISQIKNKVEAKGFKLDANGFVNVDDAHIEANRRVDLFLSDNNLGNNPNHQDNAKQNGGIDFYLQLRNMKAQAYLCDFVLYTRSTQDEIVNKISNELNDKKDPNLFSRFTFVSRNAGGEGWHQPVLNLLDHILTKREEINTLRAIYAQYVSRIDLHLKNKFSIPLDKTLHDTINLIPNSLGINTSLLHEIRKIRNGLMHNDEERCPATQQWAIKYEKLDNTIDLILEDELQKFRDKLNQAYSLVMSLP